MTSDAASLLALPVSSSPRRTAHPRFDIERLAPGPWLAVRTLRFFEFNRVTIYVKDLAPALQDLRVLHLSDLHIRFRWQPAYDLLFGKLRDDPPDVVVISGDFVEHRADHRKAWPLVERFVKNLPSRLGIWGILGNHDGDLLGPRLRDWGVHLITDQLARLQNHEAAIELVGVRSVHRKDVKAEFVDSIPPLTPSVPRLILAHFPDSIRSFRNVAAHAFLSGHTHGGQICLPGGLPLITHDSLPRKMCKGVHPFDGKLLIVNRGFGFASTAMRTFCPPEVIELRFRRA